MRRVTMVVMGAACLAALPLRAEQAVGAIPTTSSGVATPVAAEASLAEAVAELADWVRQPALWPEGEVALELRAIELREGRFRLTGAANDMSVYSLLLRALERDPRFEGVSMGTMERQVWGLTFEIGGEFHPGEGRWGILLATQVLGRVAAAKGVAVRALRLDPEWIFTQEDPLSLVVDCRAPDQETKRSFVTALTQAGAASSIDVQGTNLFPANERGEPGSLFTVTLIPRAERRGRSR